MMFIAVLITYEKQKTLVNTLVQETKQTVNQLNHTFEFKTTIFKLLCCLKKTTNSLMAYKNTLLFFKKNL